MIKKRLLDAIAEGDLDALREIIPMLRRENHADAAKRLAHLAIDLGASPRVTTTPGIDPMVVVQFIGASSSCQRLLEDDAPQLGDLMAPHVGNLVRYLDGATRRYSVAIIDDDHDAAAHLIQRTPLWGAVAVVVESRDARPDQRDALAQLVQRLGTPIVATLRVRETAHLIDMERLRARLIAQLDAAPLAPPLDARPLRGWIDERVQIDDGVRPRRLLMAHLLGGVARRGDEIFLPDVDQTHPVKLEKFRRRVPDASAGERCAFAVPPYRPAPAPGSWLVAPGANEPVSDAFEAIITARDPLSDDASLTIETFGTPWSHGGQTCAATAEVLAELRSARLVRVQLESPRLVPAGLPITLRDRTRAVQGVITRPLPPPRFWRDLAASI